MRLLVLGLPLLTVAAIACGGGSSSNDRVLHFTGRDETEGNFRARLRDTMNDNLAGMLILCNQVKDLKPSEALIIVRNDSGDNSVPEGATPKPGQTATHDDLVRSAEIVQEECERDLL